jgi:para-aminobenzoate synthetase component 1
MRASPFPRFEALPYVEESSRYFDALKDLDWPVFLDSGERLNGRSDIIAAAPCKKLVTRGDTTRILEDGKVSESREDPFWLVREALGEPAGHFTPLAFEGGAIGYFGYDLGRRIEKLPELAQDIDGLPEMMIGIYDWVVVVDHEKRQAWLVAHGRVSQTAAIWHELLQRLNQLPVHPAAEPLRAPGGFEAGIDRDEYRRQFARIQAWIRDGDCYQVNYTQRFDAYVEGDGWQAYREMHALNPVPFGAFLRFDKLEILSFSPERFLKLEGRHVTTEPIKGTRPRSEDPDKDLHLQHELSQSLKDRAENLMIVDLLRNDLGRVCAPGSIDVRDLFKVESFPTVHHMVSTVSGRLRNGEDALSLLRACFPGGSITGAPKIRAMEIIEELEPARRGIYCGAIGYIGFNGDMDTSIVIRTLVRRGDRAHYWVGGGIVADSDPDEEYQECLDKARAFRRYFSPVD